MARLTVFFAVVAAGVAGALFLISERAAITRTGYRVARLERERRELLERNRQLRARVERLKTTASLVDRIKSFQLDIVPPEEGLEPQEAHPRRADF